MLNDREAMTKLLHRFRDQHNCNVTVTARDKCIYPEFNFADIMVRPLPIGVQDFKEVRDEGYLYVDKTDIIHQILSQKSEVY